MAQRDKSQGFAFVYVDILELLKFSKAYEAPDISVHSENNAQVVNLNKDPQSSAQSDPSPQNPSTSAIQQIRENLDRLQTLHHKLHAMLAELNHATVPGKKKKENSAAPSLLCRRGTSSRTINRLFAIFFPARVPRTIPGIDEFHAATPI